MIGGNSHGESDMMRRIQAVLDCEGTAFADVLKAAGIDPKRGLRYRNVSGQSFEGQDLRGMDFTGANLTGCNFKSALVEGACFDRARLGAFGPMTNDVNNLTLAADWEQHVRSWKPLVDDPGLRESHLAPWSYFMDTPQLPLMFVVPFPVFLDGSIRRIALSGSMVSVYDYERFAPRPSKRLPGEFDGPRVFSTSSDVTAYLTWCRGQTGLDYRMPISTEWDQIADWTNRVNDSRHPLALSEFGSTFGHWGYCDRDGTGRDVHLRHMSETKPLSSSDVMPHLRLARTLRS